MKTIRKGTFESNSSSSHTFTFSSFSLAEPDLTIVQTEGQYVVDFEAYVDLTESVHPKAKLKMLLPMAQWVGGNALRNQVVKVFEDFTGVTVVLNPTGYFGYDDNGDRVKPTIEHITEKIAATAIAYKTAIEDDEDTDDILCEFLSGWSYNDYGEDPYILTDALKDDEAIRSFLFSSSNGCVGEYSYDG